MALTSIENLMDNLKSSEGENVVFDDDKIKRDFESDSIAHTNITVYVLSIIGGLVATIFFLGFLALTQIYESKPAVLFCGVLFIVSALILIRIVNNILLDTSIIAIYIVGYILLGFGLMEEYRMDFNSILVLFMLISIIAIVFSVNFMPAFLSVLIFNGCLTSLTLVDNENYELIEILTVYAGIFFVLITFFEAKIVSFSTKLNQLFKPVRSGFFVSFIIGLVIVGLKVILQHERFVEVKDHHWILSCFIGLGVLIIIFKIIQKLDIKKTRDIILIFGFSLMFLIPTFYAPSISGSIFLLLVSYYYGYKLEIVTSIILLIYFISQYYYDLQFTLLVKSMILFGSGILLICAWLFFNKQLKKS